MGSHSKLPAAEVFENAHAGDACLDYQRDLREIGKYLDLDIETAGGGVIRAHRWVVEARFPVLRKLFRDNLRSQQINLSRYSTEAVEAVIDYAYGTRLLVTEDTVLKLLLLGQNLNCGEIVGWCRSFICQRISETNVREVWKTANWSSDEELLRACVPKMMAHFARAQIEPRLLEVTEAPGLRSLLSDERSGGLSALSKVSALAAWVNAAPEREMQRLRTDAFTDLVALINFEGVSASEMADYFFDKTLLALPESNREVLREQMRRTMAVPSTSRAAPRRDDAFWVVSYNEGKRVTLQPLRCDAKLNFGDRDGACYACHANESPGSVDAYIRVGKIYVAGGEVRDTVLNTFESRDPTKGQRASLPPMTVAREGHACVATDRFLYVLGGWNEVESVLSSCERYTWAQGRWERIPAMRVGRSTIAAVRVAGYGLLAIGGYNGSWLNEVELLQLNGEAEDVTSWRPMAPMLQERQCPSACYCGSSVFVCSRGEKDFDLERLDITGGATGQWTRIACKFTFTEDPWHFLLPLNGSLWIIGDCGGMYEVALAEDARGKSTDCRVTKRNRIEGFSRDHYIFEVFNA